MTHLDAEHVIVGQPQIAPTVQSYFVENARMDTSMIIKVVKHVNVDPIQPTQRVLIVQNQWPVLWIHVLHSQHNVKMPPDVSPIIVVDVKRNTIMQTELKFVSLLIIIPIVPS